jgi:hypothetical protein
MAKKHFPRDAIKCDNLLYRSFHCMPEGDKPPPAWMQDVTSITAWVMRERAERTADALLAEYVLPPKMQEEAIREYMIEWVMQTIKPNEDEDEDEDMTA